MPCTYEVQGPLEDSGVWQSDGVIGLRRFSTGYFSLVQSENEGGTIEDRLRWSGCCTDDPQVTEDLSI